MYGFASLYFGAHMIELSCYQMHHRPYSLHLLSYMVKEILIPPIKRSTSANQVKEELRTIRALTEGIFGFESYHLLPIGSVILYKWLFSSLSYKTRKFLLHHKSLLGLHWLCLLQGTHGNIL